MSLKGKAYSEISQHKLKLAENNFICSEIDEKQYNYEFSAELNRSKNKVQVYFGKKGIKTVIQGNKLSDEYKKLNNIITGTIELPFINEDKHFDEYVGTDETGKGDYFGPLVVAGVYVNNEICDVLNNFNVKDSKELSDFQIDSIAHSIKKKYKNIYSILSINPKRYNELYANFLNINSILDWAHSKVIENLITTVKTNNVIVDQFSSKPLTILNKKEFHDLEIIQTPKAERYLGVAAASILARNEMNNWFNKKNVLGYNISKGASARVENEAKELVNKHGENCLSDFVKLHFKTTKKLFED